MSTPAHASLPSACWRGISAEQLLSVVLAPSENRLQEWDKKERPRQGAGNWTTQSSSLHSDIQPQDEIFGTHAKHRVEKNIHIPQIHESGLTRGNPGSSVHAEVPPFRSFPAQLALLLAIVSLH